MLQAIVFEILLPVHPYFIEILPIDLFDSTLNYQIIDRIIELIAPVSHSD